MRFYLSASALLTFFLFTSNETEEKCDYCLILSCCQGHEVFVLSLQSTSQMHHGKKNYAALHLHLPLAPLYSNIHLQLSELKCFQCKVYFNSDMFGWFCLKLLVAQFFPVTRVMAAKQQQNQRHTNKNSCCHLCLLEFP